MNRNTIIGIAVASMLLILGIVYISMSVSLNNREARLRNQIEAKVKVNKSAYTKMFEILVNEAGVAAQYADDFKSIYPSLIEGRYNNGGGQLMQWIQEHNPTFDISLYQRLMQSIEAQRETFHTNQEQLVDMSREHNNLLDTFPGSWFLSSKERIEIPVVINNASEKAFETGLEQDMNLFRKPKDTTSK
jgi:hypothetical protein